MSKTAWNVPGTMASAERKALITALIACDYNVAQASRMLQIGRSSMYRLIKTYEICVPSLPKRRDEARPSEPVVKADVRVTLENGNYVLHRAHHEECR